MCSILLVIFCEAFWLRILPPFIPAHMVVIIKSDTADKLQLVTNYRPISYAALIIKRTRKCWLIGCKLWCGVWLENSGRTVFERYFQQFTRCKRRPPVLFSSVSQGAEAPDRFRKSVWSGKARTSCATSFCNIVTLAVCIGVEKVLVAKMWLNI